jgi:C4-dicarboxylate-specific signal transduction histidine kinase
VETDRNYLRSILYNLTANATKAVDGMAGASIEWQAWTASGEVQLSITDNGPGIRDRRELSALFDETEISGSSRGLGLHIIRDLAKAIGCRVEAGSLPGQGMRFTLFFTSAGR